MIASAGRRSESRRMGAIRVVRTVCRCLPVAVMAVVALVCLLGANKPAPLAPGLVADMGGISRVAASPNFTLAPNESVYPQVSPDFSIAYHGVIRILQEGDYTFTAAVDNIRDMVGVQVDGRGDNPIHLAPGDHALEVHYAHRPPGPVRLQLLWASAKFPEEPIPPAVL